MQQLQAHFAGRGDGGEAKDGDAKREGQEAFVGLKAGVPTRGSWSWAWALDADERPPPSSIVARRDTQEAVELARIADQAVLAEEEGKVSANMVRWAEGLGRETIVRVVGVVLEPPREAGQEQVKSASVHEREVRVQMVRLCLLLTVPTFPR